MGRKCQICNRIEGVVYENQSLYREFFRSRIESEGIQRVIEETYEEVLVMIRQKNGCEDSPEKIAQIIAGIVEKQMEGIL